MADMSKADIAPLMAMPARKKTPRKKIAVLGGRVLEMGLSAIFLFALWEGIVRFFAVPSYIFPAPSAVTVALWQGIVNGAYTKALIVTTNEIVVGLFLGSLIGILLGFAMVSIPRLDRLIYPYVVASQTVPKVAIAPLFIVWFGLGIESKIIIVALTCLFPLLVNTMAGMRATDPGRVALVRALCGSRPQLLWYVQLPSALPYIFAGLHTAVVLSVIGAIVGEFVGAKQGLGVMVLQANFNLDLAAVFALLVILALMGVILSGIVSWLEKRVCFWAGR